MKLDYYNSGCAQVAIDSPLTLTRLEKRRNLTGDSNRLVIALVGLPGRGKSFVARKLLNFLQWYGVNTKIFNVGKYRRTAFKEISESSSGACAADFFDSSNIAASEIREKVAEVALKDMLRWLDEEIGVEEQTEDVLRQSRIAIFDATNSTNRRRQWVLEECTSPAKRRDKPTGVIFLESVCDDEELLNENFSFKISNSPDYKDMSKEEAMKDLKERVGKYETRYETITDDSISYIKIFNLSTKILVNHIYGRMAKLIVPAIMAWNISTRPVFLCRSGQTTLTETNSLDSSQLEKDSRGRSSLLGSVGKTFSKELYEFVMKEGIDFMNKRSSIMDMASTGTSISGLVTKSYSGTDKQAPFPLQLYTSTMPRAAETVAWSEEFDFRVNELSNLNPLDRGDFAGKELEEVQLVDPSWYEKLTLHPFTTRFPGGESFQDVARRLASVVVDFEQHVTPTLVVGHVSTLQLLLSYFRGSPVHKAMEIEVPLHTVIKFVPSRGGGWTETEIPLLSPSPNHTLNVSGDILAEKSKFPYPFWGDHKKFSSLQSFDV